MLSLIPRLLVISSLSLFVDGAGKRCYVCRSRGELGSCKDPFTFNATLVENEKGIDIVPCASGWCAKTLEGGGSFDEYGVATQRQCLPRGPSDSEERCANTEWKHKKVFMCFCKGDLCNGTSVNKPILASFIILLTFIYVR